MSANNNEIEKRKEMAFNAIKNAFGNAGDEDGGTLFVLRSQWRVSFN